MDESTPDAATLRSTPEISRRATLRANPARIDLAKAWTKAKARIKDASGLDVDKESRKLTEPVARARRLAEVASPMDMRLSIMLGLGCTPDELERDKSGARLMLEAAHKRMSIVGLRSGEVQEHELSDRFQEFFARFTRSGARAERALPPKGADDAL